MGRILLLSMFLFMWSLQGQNPCPTIDDPAQDFCESEGAGNNFHKPRISDLVATDNGGGVVWYASATSTEALGSDVLLENGATYYADNTEGSCTSRPSCQVSILDAPNAGATTFVSFCSNDDPVDLVTEFKPSILGPADPGGTFTPVLASGGTIFDPAVDAGGRYKYTVTSNTGCPNDDSYIYITVNKAPDAGEDGVANINSGDAPTDLYSFLGGNPDEGGIWSPALASGTGVFDPAVDSPQAYTYTVAGTGACDDATAVIVVNLSNEPVPLACPTIDDPAQDFCESEGTGNNFHKPRISDLVATDNGGGVVWYASATSTEALGSDVLLENGATYYADNSEGSCTSRPSCQVSISDAPNAGATTFVSFCSNDDPVDLVTELKPSILGPADPGGTFTPALASGGTIFDPAVDAAGRYKYTVTGNTGCPNDDSYIYITVNKAPDAGEDGVANINSGDAPTDLYSFLGGTPDEGGTWSPALASGTGVFDPAVDSPQAYTYTVAGTGACDDATAVVVVNLSNEPVPLACPSIEDPNQDFCESEGTGNNFHKPRISDLLATDNGGGVVWYASATSTEALGSDVLLENGATYYADNTEGSCTSRPSCQVSISEAPNAGATTFVSFCSNDDPVDLVTKLKPSILGPADPGGIFTPALASGGTIFDPAVDAAGRYKYTVTGNTGCPNDDSYIYITVENCSDEQSLVIYPNPSRDIFNFGIDPSVKVNRVRIIQSTGIVLKDVHVDGELKTINLNSFKPGIYFAEIYTSEGKTVKRLIKK